MPAVGRRAALGQLFARRSGGIFVDMGVHEFDQARWLTGSDFTAADGDALRCSITDCDVRGDPDSAQVLGRSRPGRDGTSCRSDATTPGGHGERRGLWHEVTTCFASSSTRRTASARSSRRCGVRRHLSRNYARGGAVPRRNGRRRHRRARSRDRGRGQVSTVDAAEAARP